MTILSTILLASLSTFTANATDDAGLVHERLSYTDIADGRSSSLARGFVGTYVSQHGYEVTKGDELELGVPTAAASRTALIGGGSGVYGAAAATTHVDYFQYVYNGTYDATVGKMLVAGLAGAYDPTLYQAVATLSGTKVAIQRIKLGGTKKRPVVWMECEIVDSREKENRSGIITISDYDPAIAAGEVIDPRFITRDIAVAKLREAKEMFELGVYSQEQLDAAIEKYGPHVTPP